MSHSEESRQTIVDGRRKSLEVEMVGEERWTEIRRLYDEEGRSISSIARLLDLDRKMIRRCVREPAWQPYQRQPVTATMLTPRRQWLEARAPQVRYSARIQYQELRQQRGFSGSYETVKRFVAPLREPAGAEALTDAKRVETVPGEQSQIDWGQVSVRFCHGPVKLHLFVLTLGYSRRCFYWG